MAQLPYRRLAAACALAVLAGGSTAAADPSPPPLTEALRREYAHFAGEALDGVRPEAGAARSAVDDTTTALDARTSAVVTSMRRDGSVATVGIGLAASPVRVARVRATPHGYAYDFAGGSMEAHLLRSGGVRYLARLDRPGAPRRFRFDVRLPADAEIVRTLDQSAIVLRRGAGATETPDGVFVSPVAKDANGADVPVRQVFTDRGVELIVEPTAQTRYPVLADPTYVPVSCTTVTRGGSAATYLRDTGACPYGVTFVWANGYWPVRAAIQGGSMRVVRQAGSCTGVPDTGLWFDFQVPCRAHDYCYDLYRVRAPFDYAAVEKFDCDVEFLLAMVEHCNARTVEIPPLCHETALTYFEGVVVLGSPTRGERPSGDWPYPGNELLEDHNFANGLSGWVLRADPGNSANWAIYQDPNRQYLEFNCANTAPTCSILKDKTFPGPDDVKRSARLRGGERVQASGVFRCAGAGSVCPVTIALWARRTNGQWLLVAASDYQLTNPNQLQFWQLATSGTLPLNGVYDTLRWEAYNKAGYRNVDVRDAVINLLNT